MKILSFVLGIMLLTSVCQGIETPERTFQNSLDNFLPEIDELIIAEYPLKNYCSLGDFMERVKELSESPTLTMEVKEVLKELSIRCISSNQESSLRFLKNKNCSLEKIEKLIQALDVPQSLIGLEILVLKTNQNYLSAPITTNGTFTVSMDSIIFKGDTYHALTDFYQAISVDPDVEILNRSLVSCKEFSQRSVYAETIRMMPKKFFTERKPMIVDKNVYEARFSATLRPSISTENHISIQFLLENSFPELASNTLHLSSYLESRKFSFDLVVPNNSFGILGGVAIDEGMSYQLGGMLVLGDINQNQNDHQQIFTLIIKPVIIEKKEHPKLEAVLKNSLRRT